jgi:hypothetical protein
MKDILILVCAALLLATAITHSLVGEQKLIQPLLTKREGILKHDLARVVMQLAWHITSLSWIVIAIILVAFVVKPEQALQSTLVAVGVSFTLVGVFDAIASKGRHLGWPMLTAIGLFALGALVMR